MSNSDCIQAACRNASMDSAGEEIATDRVTESAFSGPAPMHGDVSPNSPITSSLTFVLESFDSPNFVLIPSHARNVGMRRTCPNKV